jgi:bifunctional UDP-N-acetylglucosamine pyrophosphorylase/glucosamine-1-phosphate N-acetyltransferase
MQSVILAAGKGSRLNPITTRRSKAMLPILGKPIVERVMETLAHNGVDDFILVVSPDDRYITNYFRRESRLEAEVRFVYQPQRLGMANALMCAAPLIEADFVLSACDNLLPEGEITRLLAAWRAQPRPNAVLTLMRIPPEQVVSSGIVDMQGGWVQRIVEKPTLEQAPSDIASLPLYCLPESVLEYLPQIQPSERGEYELQDAIQMLIERQGRVRGVMVPERLTLTRPADLLKINRHYLTAGDNKPQLQPQTVGPNTHLITPLHIEAGTVIGANCTIGPNVYIERDCRIGEGVRLRDAILLREAQVPDRSEICDEVVS